MLVKLTDAAHEFNLSIDNVRAKVRKGLWPVYKFGPKGLRVDIDEIKRLARSTAEGKKNV